ncbi:MraY family glycosyltransferase [Sphingobacterium hotanense]|uniref:Glycosyltransferase family 4 protein n=1 Tax=Sphingobacterium hotanense TaxID=649196 RepID=A0ABT7NL35_9SPHI|nr:glycosyltransferase family 4 protein [Sphingobacterium hotanense]MDM1047944.1 glycosyltransferase family 4 protein [Sphingobacterium hotanense]
MNEIFIYAFVFLVLFVLELLYFKIAKRYNIVDRPNSRSSHSTVTLRGGGIIFYLAVLIYFLVSNFNYPWFFLGLSLMTIISFLDDILTLSNRVRLFVHFASVLLLSHQLGLFNYSWYYLLFSFVFIVGIINAYNFMDGINGITASYSLAIILLLLIVDSNFDFIDTKFLIFSTLSLIVFSFFNFRNNAKTFAGDVGSVSIAFIIVFAIGSLIVKSGNIIYIMFLSVYGIDTVWTIINRILKKENIFKAHRSHLYQFLVNEAKQNKLIVSFSYGLLQFLVGLLVIWISNYNIRLQIVVSLSILILLSIFYLSFKKIIYDKFVINKSV